MQVLLVCSILTEHAATLVQLKVQLIRQLKLKYKLKMRYRKSVYCADGDRGHLLYEFGKWSVVENTANNWCHTQSEPLSADTRAQMPLRL